LNVSNLARKEIVFKKQRYRSSELFLNGWKAFKGKFRPAVDWEKDTTTKCFYLFKKIK
jgi:hypothetical protein